MYDSFGKIHAIWISVNMLFFIPLFLYYQRQENVMQMYLLTQTSYFVDAVRNTGILTKTMYEEYEQILLKTDRRYDLDVEHFHMTYQQGKEQFELQKEYIPYQKIKEILYQDEVYFLSQGDFIRVQVTEVHSSIFKQLLGLEQEIVVYYGGNVRYEVN